MAYYYTVEVAEFINNTLGGSADITYVPGIDDASYYTFTTNPTPIYKGTLVRYTIRAFKGTFPTGVQMDNSKVFVDFATGFIDAQTGNYIFGDIITKTEGSADKFWFTMKTKKAPISMRLSMKVQLKPGTSENSGETYVNIPIQGTMPTINWTAAKSDPKVPSTVAAMGFGDNRLQFNNCTKQWVGLLTQEIPNQGTKSTVYYYDTKGVLKNTKVFGIDAGFSNTNFNKAQVELLTALTANCNKIAGEASVPASEPPTYDKIQWNPPTHFSTRKSSFSEVINLDPSKVIVGENATPQGLKDIARYRDNLGKIFQDSAGASVLNQGKPKDKNMLPNTKPWGFRFTYNPTTFGYSTSANNSIDWTLGSKDPAVLLQGNQSVTFDLYLNRIADMSHLKTFGGNAADKNNTGYPRPLNKEEIDGILNRGTEYDIEFLYRVLNGNPMKSNLLLDPNYKGYTADFGYITGTPCWLHMHNNMRYFGGVASMSVNHMIMDLNMVPMLSVVSLTFARYPAMWNINSAEFKAAFSQNISGTTASSEG